MKRKKYPIHPDFQPLAKLNPPLNRAALAAARKSMAALWALERSGDGVTVKKLEIPLDKMNSMQAILYEPEDCEAAEAGEGVSDKLPCLVYYHGGGFVFNAAPYHFTNAREYCREAHCKVLFIDYRLAPKHPYPAAADDAFAAYRWAQINCESLGIDFHRIAVGGDSAGGNLAAAVCLMARDYGAAVPCGMLLMYPAVGAREITESVKQFTDTPMCNSRDMEKYGQLYNPHKERLSPEELVYASPGEAECLAGMPPAYVETAEFDCLRDEGAIFAHRLEAEGIYTVLNETKGTVHGYDFMTKSVITRDSLRQRTAFLRQIFEEK